VLCFSVDAAVFLAVSWRIRPSGIVELTVSGRYSFVSSVFALLLVLNQYKNVGAKSSFVCIGTVLVRKV